ncbi:MAG: universal stress protein [Polyangiales bacterium]
MSHSSSTVLAVTDLTVASYRLVGFAATVAKPADGEVVLISSYRESRVRQTDPPSDPALKRLHRRRVEASLRHEGQLLERQRQWCADRGVRCRAELFEEASWPDFIISSARRAGADLILLGERLLGTDSNILPEDMKRLASDAPCPVSLVQMPTFWVF